jgi:hypothetical protein
MLVTRIFAGMLCLPWDEFGSAGSYQGDDASSNLGALVVSGGAGIQGNVNVGGYAGVVGDMDGVVVRSYMAV